MSEYLLKNRFQNKRCKDKKRSILMKQMQQQEKVSQIKDLKSNFEIMLL
jgi:hypothetical protein